MRMENIFYDNILLMENEAVHQGEQLKNLLKGKGLKMEAVASDLKMTRQNLNYHLRKAELDDDFRRLVEEKLKIKLNGSDFVQNNLLKEDTVNYPLRDAFDIGAYGENDQREIYRGKEYIDLGNGNYLLYTPLIPHIASLGYLAGYSDPVWLEELPKHGITVDFIPKGIYRTFIGRGDSMDDGTKRSISNNDKVTGRVIDKQYWKSKLHLHKYQLYIIVHREGITIKEISKHDVENGVITIHSWNPDKKKYPDIELKLQDVLQLLNVIKIERDV